MSCPASGRAPPSVRSATDHCTHVAWHTGSLMYCVLDGDAGGAGGRLGGTGGAGGGGGGAPGGEGANGGLGGGLGGGGGGLGTGMGGGAGGCGGRGGGGGTGGGDSVAYCATPERASRMPTHASGLAASGSVAAHSRKLVMVALSVWYVHVITCASVPQSDAGAISACESGASSLCTDAASGLHRSDAAAAVALPPPRTSSCRMANRRSPYACPGKAGGLGGGVGGGGGFGGGGDAICAGSDMVRVRRAALACVRRYTQLCALSDHDKAWMLPFKRKWSMLEEDYDEFVVDDPEPPREYKESRATQCCLRCAGGGCWIVLGLCIVAWVAHSVSIEGSSSLSDAPAFSKTLLWRSLAHHTDAWTDAYLAVSPPPPGFT